MPWIRRLARRLLPAALLLAAAAGAAAGEPAPPLLTAELTLDAPPNFVFADEPLHLNLTLRLARSRPGPKGRIFPEPLAARLLVTRQGRNLAVREARIPNEVGRPEPLALILPPAGTAGHETLKLSLTSETLPEATAELVWVGVRESRPPQVELVLDHFVDQAGRRVIFVIDRQSEATARRWLPLKLLADLARPVSPEWLLVGPALDSGQYARDLAAARSDLRLTSALAEPGPGYPVHRLFLAALQAPRDELYLALQATAARLGGHSVLAAPVRVGQDGSPYAAAVSRVARERNLPLAELGEWPHPGQNAVERIEDRRPSPEQCRRLVGQLAAAMTHRRVGRAAALGLLVFVVASGSLFWLRRRARFGQ